MSRLRVRCASTNNSPTTSNQQACMFAFSCSHPNLAEGHLSIEVLYYPGLCRREPHSHVVNGSPPRFCSRGFISATSGSPESIKPRAARREGMTSWPELITNAYVSAVRSSSSEHIRHRHNDRAKRIGDRDANAGNWNANSDYRGFETERIVHQEIEETSSPSTRSRQAKPPRRRRSVYLRQQQGDHQRSTAREVEISTFYWVDGRPRHRP